MKLCGRCSKKHYAKGFCFTHYRELNKENLKKYNYNFNIKNKQKIKKRKDKWKIKNINSIRKYEQQYYNKVKITEEYRKKKNKYNRKYYHKFPEKTLGYIRKRLDKMILKLDHKHIRNSIEFEYALNAWGKIIKKRDKICVVCGSKIRLNSHHIIHKKDYPKLSFIINNGISLCKTHHDEVHGNKISVLTN